MRLKKWFFQMILVSLVLTAFCAPVNADPVENSLGFGLGLPYGGIGINYEIGLNDFIAPTLGVGYLPDNVGWNVGLRLYYPGRDHKFRCRITALYGTNTLLEKKNSFFNDDDSEYDTETGFSGGIGFNWRFGSAWALDADVFFADADMPEDYEEKGGDVKFSLGFSRRF